MHKNLSQLLARGTVDNNELTHSEMSSLSNNEDANNYSYSESQQTQGEKGKGHKQEKVNSFQAVLFNLFLKPFRVLIFNCRCCRTSHDQKEEKPLTAFEWHK